MVWNWNQRAMKRWWSDVESDRGEVQVTPRSLNFTADRKGTLSVAIFWTRSDAKITERSRIWDRIWKVRIVRTYWRWLIVLDLCHSLYDVRAGGLIESFLTCWVWSLTFSTGFSVNFPTAKAYTFTRSFNHILKTTKQRLDIKVISTFIFEPIFHLHFLNIKWKWPTTFSTFITEVQ